MCSSGFIVLLVSCSDEARTLSDAPQLDLTGCRVTDVVNLLIDSTNPSWLHAVS